MRTMVTSLVIGSQNVVCFAVSGAALSVWALMLGSQRLLDQAV